MIKSNMVNIDLLMKLNNKRFELKAERTEHTERAHNYRTMAAKEVAQGIKCTKAMEELDMQIQDVLMKAEDEIHKLR